MPTQGQQAVKSPHAAGPVGAPQAEDALNGREVFEDAEFPPDGVDVKGSVPASPLLAFTHGPTGTNSRRARRVPRTESIDSTYGSDFKANPQDPTRSNRFPAEPAASQYQRERPRERSRISVATPGAGCIVDGTSVPPQRATLFLDLGARSTGPAHLDADWTVPPWFPRWFAAGGSEPARIMSQRSGQPGPQLHLLAAAAERLPSSATATRRRQP